jgi:hypothetical protein
MSIADLSQVLGDARVDAYQPPLSEKMFASGIGLNAGDAANRRIRATPLCEWTLMIFWETASRVIQLREYGHKNDGGRDEDNDRNDGSIRNSAGGKIDLHLPGPLRQFGKIFIAQLATALSTLW